jgi:hypothetical protein
LGSLEGEKSHREQYTKHTGNEEQEGIYTIEPPEGPDKHSHAFENRE